jgi:hypothetical protein
LDDWQHLRADHLWSFRLLAVHGGHWCSAEVGRDVIMLMAALGL